MDVAWTIMLSRTIKYNNPYGLVLKRATSLSIHPSGRHVTGTYHRQRTGRVRVKRSGFALSSAMTA